MAIFFCEQLSGAMQLHLVDGGVFHKFIATYYSPCLPRWMEDHCDNVEEDEGCLCNALDEKDAHLSNLEEDFLFELMLAANFLDVPGLLDALAKVGRFFSTVLFHTLSSRWWP